MKISDHMNRLFPEEHNEYEWHSERVVADAVVVDFVYGHGVGAVSLFSFPHAQYPQALKAIEEISAEGAVTLGRIRRCMKEAGVEVD